MKRKNRIERELDQKELESDIGKNLKDEELERKKRENQNKEYHPFTLMAINLIGNLVVGNIIFFITIGALWRVFPFFPDSVNTVYFLLFQLIIWVIAIIGVITKKSPWEKMFK